MTPERRPAVVFCPVGSGAAFLFDRVEDDGLYSDHNLGEALMWLTSGHGGCERPGADHYVSYCYDPYEMNGS